MNLIKGRHLHQEVAANHPPELLLSQVNLIRRTIDDRRKHSLEKHEFLDYGIYMKHNY